MDGWMDGWMDGYINKINKRLLTLFYTFLTLDKLVKEVLLTPKREVPVQSFE